VKSLRPQLCSPDRIVLKHFTWYPSQDIGVQAAVAKLTQQNPTESHPAKVL
jgi:hypothetical protein